MKITLVNLIFGKMHFDHSGTNSFYRTFALGPAYLTSYLERNGLLVDYLDYSLSLEEVEEVDVEDFMSFLGTPQDVIGLGCMNNLLHFTLLCAAEIKRRWPEKKIILGGPGVSGVAHAVLESFPDIDVAISGEAEKKLLEVVRRIDDPSVLRQIPAICFRNRDEVTTTPPDQRFLIQNLDDLPWPAYERVPLDQYTAIGIMTARGCPYSCTFCDSPALWGNAYRRRSIDDVLDEIECLYYRHLVQHIYIWDDTFLVNRKRVETFCNSLIERRIPIFWSAYGRVDQVDDRLLELLARSGCINLFYGIESGSNSTLEQMKKGFTIEKAIDVLKRSRRILEKVSTGFIWGFPYETMQDFWQTVKVIDRLIHDGVRVRCVPLNPCPNAELYELYKDQLVFDPLFQPYLIRFRKASLYCQISRMVAEHPRIFPNFWTIRSDLFDKKRKVVEILNHQHPESYLLYTY